MRRAELIEQDIQDADLDLEEIATMTDKEVCTAYNVDYRAEIIQMINEDKEALLKELEETADVERYDAAKEIFGSYEAMYNF